MIQAKTASPIQITQSENGTRMKDLSNKIITASISIATSGLIFCGGFMWKTNAAVVRIEQILIEKEKSDNDLNGKVNNLQLDVRQMRDDVIELKTLKTQKQ